jgi:hypothetical protein
MYGTPYDGRKIAVAALAGGVSGGIAALTGGLSIAGNTIFGAVSSPALKIGIMGAAEVIEGGIERGLDGDPDTAVLDPVSATIDLGSGLTGGLIGERFAEGYMKSALYHAKLAGLQDKLAMANRMANSGKTSKIKAAGRQLMADVRAQIAATKQAVGAFAFISELVGKPIEETVKGAVQAKPRDGLDVNKCGQGGNPPCVVLK